MFTMKTTKQNLGIEISGSYEDLNILYDSIARLCGVDVKQYEGVQNRIYAFLYELRHTYQGNREVLTKSEKSSSLNSIEVHYMNRILWTEILFVIFALEDYKTMCIHDKRHFITSDQQLQPIYAEYKAHCQRDIALVSYFQECIWDELKFVIGTIRVKSLRKLLADHKMNYRGYCPQAIDFMNKRLVQAFVENRAKVIGELARVMIKKDSGYAQLEESIKKFAEENAISYYEVDFEGNEIMDVESLEW